MKRDENGVLYAIWNPIPQYNGREEPGKVFMGGRTPYVIAVSRDNGQTFTEPVSFEEEEDHGYCYCAIHFTKDAMLLAYCAGGAGGRKLSDQNENPEDTAFPAGGNTLSRREFS